VQRTRIAASIVTIEGIAAIVTGVAFAIEAIVGHPSDRGTGIFLGLLLAAYGLAIVAVARGIDRERRWARTPAFLTQFFAVVVVWYNRGSLPVVTAVVGAVAIAATVALVFAQSSASKPSRN
jgi:predicted permease